MNKCCFANLRIAGPAKYTPSYINNEGKTISAKAEFNCIENERGKSERKNTVKFTAWGGLADTMARSGAPGKKLTIHAIYRSYETRVWYPQPDGTRSPIQLPDGSFMMTTRGGFTVEDIDFDMDSKKRIGVEIQLFNDSNGTDICSRPAGWDQDGTQAAQTWANIIAARNSTEYQPGMKKFVFADVVEIPTGCQYAPKKSAGSAQVVVQNQAPAVQPGFTPNVGNPNVNVQNGQVQVHGQPMGQTFAQPTAPVQGQAPAMGFAPPTAPVQNTAPAMSGSAVY